MAAGWAKPRGAGMLYRYVFDVSTAACVTPFGGNWYHNLVADTIGPGVGARRPYLETFRGARLALFWLAIGSLGFVFVP